MAKAIPEAGPERFKRGKIRKLPVAKANKAIKAEQPQNGAAHRHHPELGAALHPERSLQAAGNRDSALAPAEIGTLPTFGTAAA